MKVIPEIVDQDKRQSIASRILLMGDDNDLIFIDTNILVWIYRLNTESYRELQIFLGNLISDKRLVIPNWVIHEYNSLLNNYSENVFFPFKKRLRSLEKEISYLDEIGRLIADNEFSKKNGFTNKREFMTEIKSESESLRKKINLLTNKNNYKNEKRRTFIEELVEKAQSTCNISELVKKMGNNEFRYNHRIPPGFEDESKAENKYGDLIIWKEIIENCKLRDSKNAIFISLDSKKDWVFSPNRVIRHGKEINNNSDGTHYFILPWLAKEFKEEVNGDFFEIMNMNSVVDILYSPDHYPMEFERFKNLAKTVDIELKNSETNLIIEWLLVNGDKLHFLNNSICKWDVSPGEVDIEELRQWCVKNIRIDIDWKKVDWNNVFMQLFI